MHSSNFLSTSNELQCVCCAQLKFKLEQLTDRIKVIVSDHTDETKGDVNDSAQWCNQLNWTLCVHAHLTSNTMLIILPSVNASLDVCKIEKGIFVLQCDIKYWFLKFKVILALWPWRPLRPFFFFGKWCVSVKSVCYFNSALLWWFDVHTVEITKAKAGNHINHVIMWL